MISRREFNLILAGSIASSFLPLSSKLLEPWEYGEGIVVGMHDEIEEDELIRGFLKNRAKRAMPSGTVCEIRCSLPTDYGRRFHLGWYSSSSGQHKEPSSIERYDSALGVYVLERFVT